jgi:hypothetical protein
MRRRNGSATRRLAVQFARITRHRHRHADVDGVRVKRRNDGPVLPNRYTTQAKAIAERRVVLAGSRLAELLKATTPTPAWN